MNLVVDIIGVISEQNVSNMMSELAHFRGAVTINYTSINLFVFHEEELSANGCVYTVHCINRSSIHFIKTFGITQRSYYCHLQQIHDRTWKLLCHL